MVNYVPTHEKRVKVARKNLIAKGWALWTPEFDLMLESFYADGIKIKDIAYLLNRSLDSVNNRISTLFLDYKYPRKHRFSAQEIEYIRSNFGKITAKQIAIDLNVTYRVVYHKAWKMGLAGYSKGENHPRSKISDEDVELCRQLYDEGLRISVIAEKMELKQAFVSHICHYKVRQSLTPKRPNKTSLM